MYRLSQLKSVDALKRLFCLSILNNLTKSSTVARGPCLKIIYLQYYLVLFNLVPHRITSPLASLGSTPTSLSFLRLTLMWRSLFKSERSCWVSSLYVHCLVKRRHVRQALWTLTTRPDSICFWLTAPESSGSSQGPPPRMQTRAYHREDMSLPHGKWVRVSNSNDSGASKGIICYLSLE